MLLHKVLEIYEKYKTFTCNQSSVRVLYEMQYGTTKFPYYRRFLEANFTSQTVTKDDIIKELQKPYVCIGVRAEVNPKVHYDDYLYHQFIIVNEENHTYICSTYDFNNIVKTQEITLDKFLEFIESKDINDWNCFFEASENFTDRVMTDITVSVFTLKDKIIFPDIYDYCRHTSGAENGFVLNSADELLLYMELYKTLDYKAKEYFNKT